MPGENGGELAGLLGEMLMGGLEALAEGREGRGERRGGRAAGREALGQLAARQVPEMAEYVKSGAPYGPTNEGLLRWISERAAAAAAAAERPADVAPPPYRRLSPPTTASPRVHGSAALLKGSACAASRRPSESAASPRASGRRPRE